MQQTAEAVNDIHFTFYLAELCYEAHSLNNTLSQACDSPRLALKGGGAVTLDYFLIEESIVLLHTGENVTCEKSRALQHKGPFPGNIRSKSWSTEFVGLGCLLSIGLTNRGENGDGNCLISLQIIHGKTVLTVAVHNI